MVVRKLAGIGLLEGNSGLAMTSSVARRDAALVCCRRSRCSFVGFAGSCLRLGLGSSVLLAG